MIMHNYKSLILSLIILVLIAGCGGKKGEKLIVNEMGLTMNIPVGWKMDEYNSRLFYDPQKSHDTYGNVEDAVIQGQTLDKYVDSYYQHGYPVKIKSKTSKKIGDYDAIEVVTESVYITNEMFIERGNRVIHISLRCLKADYPKWETQFKKSFNSINVI